MSSEGCHYFLATGLEPGPPEREHEEQDMRQAWVPRARFEEMIGEGLITDDSTVAAYALLLLSERTPGAPARRPSMSISARLGIRPADGRYV